MYIVLVMVLMKYASQNCATGTQNLENENVRSSAQCEAQHIKCNKRLPGGCQPYDHYRPMYWAVVNQTRHTLLHTACTDRDLVYTARVQVVVAFKIKVHLAYSTHSVIFITTNRPLYIWWWTFCFRKSETEQINCRDTTLHRGENYFSFYCFGNYATLFPGILLKFTGLSASYILCHDDNVPIPVAAWSKP